MTTFQKLFRIIVAGPFILFVMMVLVIGDNWDFDDLRDLWWPSNQS